jgi:hypothetical protein
MKYEYVLKCWWGTEGHTDRKWIRCPSVYDVRKALKAVVGRVRRENSGKLAGRVERVDWALVEFPRGSYVGTVLLRGWEVDE